MKLKDRIIRRISAFLLVVLTLWSFLFYLAMIDEVTDEVDDTLELYTEMVMTRYLAGKELPSVDNGTNNSYHLTQVTQEYADTHPHLSFTDEMPYIEAKRETEPARVMRTIFREADGTFYELTVMTPTIEKKDFIEAILYWILGLYVVVVLAVIMVNAWVISRSMRPLYRLLEWLDLYDINEHTQPLDNPTSVTEFCTLNDTITRYSLRNQQLFEQQKRFIGDASHELQTPIAICQNRLEMLCDTDMTEEQMGEIIKTLQTLEHMSELNRSLLLLSKIDNHQFLDTMPIDIVALLRQTSAEYRRMAFENRVEVTLHEDAYPTWDINPALAKVLMHNLYRNALVHNIESQGQLHIYICKDQIVFANTGQPQPLDKAHIFDRFYKSSSRNGSSGLGLAIVNAICRHSSLAIAYDYVDGMHQFSLSQVPTWKS